MRFHAVLFIIGKHSTIAPTGTYGHKVAIPKKVAEAGMKALVGMPLWDCGQALPHDRKNILGIIETAKIVGDMAYISGFLFAPTRLTLAASSETLEISYDALDCEVAKWTDRDWVLSKWNPIGATVVAQSRAAYRKDCLYWEE